jgi:hypothetical protein
MKLAANLGFWFARLPKRNFVHFMFPGHMTVSEVMLCSSLAGLAGQPEIDMKDYW